MNYKNILLSTLLAPCALTYCNNTEIQIQRLEDDLIKKELELSKLGKEIEEQEQLIETMFDKIINIMTQELNGLNEHDKKEFRGSIILFGKRFDHATDNLEITNFLINEFFNDEKPQSIKIQRIKSMLIRSSIEKKLLKRLIQTYEAGLQQLAQLDFALCEIKK
jgi:hypothetical protein